MHFRMINLIAVAAFFSALRAAGQITEVPGSPTPPQPAGEPILRGYAVMTLIIVLVLVGLALLAILMRHLVTNESVEQMAKTASQVDEPPEEKDQSRPEQK